jgi:hypothetical protein
VRPEGQTYRNAVDSNRMFADAVDHLNRLDPLLARLELPCLLIPAITTAARCWHAAFPTMPTCRPTAPSTS